MKNRNKDTHLVSTSYTQFEVYTFFNFRSIKSLIFKFYLKFQSKTQLSGKRGTCCEANFIYRIGFIF